MKSIKVLTAISMLILVLGTVGCSKDSGSSSRPTFTPPPTGGGGNTGSCLAIDTDGDGLKDCDDPDIDNDGKLNADDAFPYDKNQWVDTDSDGVGDNYYQENGVWVGDWAPTDSTEWADSDGDLVGNNADPDDDNDGVPDQWDAFTRRSSQYSDIDFDTFGDTNEDPDNDNDGVPNIWDDVFWRQGGFDIDHDLLPTESDSDWDGDNSINEADIFPYDYREWADYDGDAVGNNADHDDDNDGVPDIWDAFPLNKNYYFDTDGDGWANEIDAFPYDANEWADTDLDGVGDNRDAFPQNPAEWNDTDNDGVGDNSDPDIDGDGFLNQLPATPVMKVSCFSQPNETACFAVSGCAWSSQGRCAPKTSCVAGGMQATCPNAAADPNNPNKLCRLLPSNYQWNPLIQPATCSADPGCTWSGSSCDQNDYFPMDIREQKDFDLDGLGDVEDPDDDNDGFPDSWDDFARNKSAFFDFDVDGIYDWQLPLIAQDMASIPAGQYAWKIDPDSDNDGVPDFWDDLSWDASEYYDIDKDGIGDNFDQDDDGDGVVDAQDAFPYDNREWFDTDIDGIGNNADPDDDNDGTPDIWDDASTNNYGWYDLNGDTILSGNFDSSGCTTTKTFCNNDVDEDGDLVANYELVCTGTTNSFTCTYPRNEDKFPYDSREVGDSDNDKLGDNEDPDDDNDGVPDLWDAFPEVSPSWADITKNGNPDELDNDIDDDGVVNASDRYPYDTTEWADYDNDGLPDNNFDADDDNDGVPDVWDDFPTNVTYWADNDKDGIPNETDIYTPNGINNEADFNTGLSRGENIALSSSFSITSCKNLSTTQMSVYSPSVTEIKTLTFAGTNDDCMLNITANKVTIAMIKFVMPVGKRGTFIRSVNNIGSQNIAQNDFVIQGVAKIADLYLTDLMNFSRNNVILETKVDLGSQPATYASLVSLQNSSTLTSTQNSGLLVPGAQYTIQSYAAGDNFTNVGAASNAVNVTFTATGTTPTKWTGGSVLRYPSDAGWFFMSNIIFWDVKTTQTVPIYFWNSAGRVRSALSQYNVISWQKPTGVNLVAGSAIFKLDIDGTFSNPNKAFFVVNNRLNLNTGQVFNVVSSTNSLSDSNYVLNFVQSKDNQSFGITTLGNSILDKNYYVDDSVSSCSSEETQAGCNLKSYCNYGGGVCNYVSGQYMSSMKDYYAFTQADTFISPQNGIYNMFYYPNTTRVNKSPALFSDSIYSADFDIYFIQAAILGGYDPVNFIGVYPPLLDQDSDGFPDNLDVFPTNPSEWYDNDGDGIGNNTDADDDNDGVFDTQEMSYCAVETGNLSCIAKTGCSWDSVSNSCRHSSTLGCLVAGSTWSSVSRCCVNVSNACVDGSDPFVADTDGDGLTDTQEMFTYGTNPLNSDTDGDGDTDAQEIANGTNPLDPLSSKDSDGDGMTDNYEITNLAPLGCINPQFKVDSDGDGINDKLEFQTYLTNPCSSDTDGDGLSDYDEINTYTTNPKLADTDGDGLTDGQEVLTYSTNPKVADTDGDGAKDGQEITDGTDPNSSASFKDTDGDGESDYADKTPYGTVPCDNNNLAACNNAYTAIELRNNFNNQMAEVLLCGQKSSSTACTSNIFDLCKWDAASTTCKPKDVVVFNDLTLDNRCYEVGAPVSGKPTMVTVRSRPNTHKTMNISSTLASVCNSAPDIVNTGDTNGVFNLNGNTGFTFQGLDFVVGSSIKVLVGNTTQATRGGFSLVTKKVSYTSPRTDGGRFVQLRDYAKVDMQQTTIRQRLNGGSGSAAPYAAVNAKNDQNFCATLSTSTNCNLSSSICTWNGSACIDNNTTSLTMKGNLISCEAESTLSLLYFNAFPYHCVDTQARTTEFDGNIIMLDDTFSLTSGQVSDSGNDIIAWTHNQGVGNFILRNSRVYSKSKTISIINGSSSVTATNMSIRDGAATADFTWTGASSPSVSLLPDNTTYNNVFTTSTSSKLMCVAGTSGDYATIHPGYFNPSPLRDFWSLINRTSAADAVQVPGSNDAQLCP